MTVTGARRRFAAVVVTLVAAAVLAACGGGGQPTTGASSPPATGTTQAATGTVVTARLLDFSIELDTQTFTPGDYTFVVQQAGQAPHALSIDGPGVPTATSAVLNAGDPDTQLTVTLQPGTYTLWCPVGSHRAQGMESTITVG